MPSRNNEIYAKLCRTSRRLQVFSLLSCPQRRNTQPLLTSLHFHGPPKQISTSECVAQHLNFPNLICKFAIFVLPRGWGPGTGFCVPLAEMKQKKNRKFLQFFFSLSPFLSLLYWNINSFKLIWMRRVLWKKVSCEKKKKLWIGEFRWCWIRKSWIRPRGVNLKAERISITSAVLIMLLYTRCVRKVSKILLQLL